MQSLPSLLLRHTTKLLLIVAPLLIASHGQAQTAISNFGQGTSGSANVGYAFNGAAERRVFSFTTGATASSFSFSSFTMAFTSATGSPGSLSVGLYSTFDTTAGTSGLLANLSLSSGNPASGGNSVFSGSATLGASTTYYLLLSAPSASSAGNYYTYPLVANSNEDSGGLAGWSIGDVGYYSLGSNPWTNNGGVSQFSIQASAVPEPSTYAAIAGAAMLGLAVWRRRRNA